MLKEQTPDTTSVPAPRTTVAEKFRELLNRALPAECQVRTAADAWMLATLAAACLTLVFPPAVAATVYCFIRAKKGGAR